MIKKMQEVFWREKECTLAIIRPTGILKILLKNTVVAWKVLRKEKPDLLISSGAAVAVPFFYLAKLMGKKLIYVEVYDRIDKPTLTGRLVYPIVDCFIVQWEEQKQVYKKAVNLGSIF